MKCTQSLELYAKKFSKKYINLYKKTGLLNLIFPDVEFDDEFPEDFKNDKFFQKKKIYKKIIIFSFYSTL